MSNGKIFALIAGAGCLGISCAGILGLVAFAALFPGKREETVGGPVAIVRRTAEAAEPAGPISYAPVTKASMAPPARFSARIPRTDEAGGWYESDSYPPQSHVADSVCAGDPEVTARLVEAARQSVERGAGPAELEAAYGEIFRYCGKPQLCEAAMKLVESNEPKPVRDLFWSGLVDCRGERYDALFEREEAPALAYVRRRSKRRYDEDAPKTSWSPKLEKAVREVALTGPQWERRITAMLLDEDDPRSAKALLDMHAAAKEASEKHDIAMAMHAQKDAKAREVFAAACKARNIDPMCSPEKDPVKPKSTAVPSLAKRVLDDAHLSLVVKENEGKPELVEALASCVRVAEEWRAYECLRSLATIDRARASRTARTLPESDSYSRELTDALIRFPEAGAIGKRLRELGFEAKEGLTARECLEEGGAAHSFDTETGMFPNEHDSLLRELAALAAADFAGVVFEEVPPREYDEEGPYEIRAYADGTRFSAKAENLGDWYDVGAVVGFLNSVAKERGKPSRFVVLASYDQTATIAAGPESGIRTAIEEKLLPMGGADDARATGKAFEEEVMRRIESGELDLGD